MPDRGALEQELQRLHERRGALEERIRFAQARGRYGEGGAAEEGREDAFEMLGREAERRLALGVVLDVNADRRLRHAVSS